MLDPVTLNVLVPLAVNYFAGYTQPQVNAFFEKVIELKPSLEKQLQSATTNQDFERIFIEAVGVIDAQAASGSIEIDGSFLEALRGIRSNHQNGFVSIADSKLQAPVIQVGGSNEGSGQTEISGSELSATGTKLRVGGDVKVKISGGAQIRMS